MATRPEDLEDDDLDLNADESGDEQDEQDEDAGDEDDDDSGEDEGGEQAGDEQDGEDDDDEEALISFDGDEGEALEGNDLVKHLRQQLKDARREAAEARKAQPVAEAKAELRPKPTLADHAYDEDAFAEDLAKWTAEKRDADEAAQEQRQAEERAAKAWKDRLGEYETGKKALGFGDVDEVEAIATSVLTPAQQVVIVKAADDPAKMVYALGKYPAKLKEIAGEEDMIALTKKIVNLERNLSVSKRTRPAPDRGLRGSAGVESSDKKLERLEKQAEKTGDRTELIKYRQSLKAK